MAKCCLVRSLAKETLQAGQLPMALRLQLQVVQQPDQATRLELQAELMLKRGGVLVNHILFLTCSGSMLVHHTKPTCLVTP